MPRIACLLAAVAMLSVGPDPAAAAPDMSAATTCVDAASGPGSTPAACIADALSDCLTQPSDTPAAASVCFREADAAFSTAIRDEMARLRGAAPERIVAIAAIEVKYDLLMGLAQCDRLRDLALVGDAETAAIQLEDDRCRAVASGMTWTRLRLRSRDL